MASYPQYTKMIAAAGYPVEDHTWSHPDLGTLSPAEVAAQIDRTQTEIASLTGHTPDCLRPPYDVWSPTVLADDAARGITTMSYSIDPRDWSLPGTQAIVDRVVSAATPGGVVDMHDGGGNRSETVAALPQIITELRAEGYRFVSICGSTTSVPEPQVSAVYPYGSAPAQSQTVTSDTAFEGVAATPDGHGYWLVAADGGIFTFGDAGFYGSLGDTVLNQPIVGMAATPDGHGYWLVAADGGIFTFGDAGFYGSGANQGTTARFFGMAPSPDGGGYLVAGEHAPGAS